MSLNPYSIRKLENPSDADIEKALYVLNAAYARSEPALYAAAGPDYFPKILPVLNAAFLRSAAIAGEIYVAEDETGSFLGVALGFGPGHEIFDSEDQTTRALSVLVTQLPSDVHKFFSEVTPRVDQFRADTFGSGAQRYIQRVAVLPKYQGMGIGSAIVKYVCTKSAGLFVALQVVENRYVKFCRNLGFQVKASMDVKAPHGEYTLTALMCPA